VTSSEAGELRTSGVVRTEQGTYSAYGENLAIEQGTLTFTGNVANPLLDVRAVRADIDMPRVGVMVSGYAVDPRVRLYSEPDMPEFDTLTWLVLAREPAGLGRDDTTLLQRAALALSRASEEAAEAGSPSASGWTRSRCAARSPVTSAIPW
jgi:translocation and assembly module TamB